MAKPKIIDVVQEVDERGFYGTSTYLGDIRSDNTCLDNVLDNGIYTFTGGTKSPTDTNGNYKWGLRVNSCEDCTSSLHVAERINYDKDRIIFARNFESNSWSKWTDFSSSIFIAVYGTTKTPEIEEAYKLGKIVVCKNSGITTIMTKRVGSTEHIFTGINGTDSIVYTCKNNAWSKKITNLSLAPTVYKITLTTSNWNESGDQYTQSCNVSGISNNENEQHISVSPASTSRKSYGEAGVYASSEGLDELTFTAEYLPDTDLTVFVTVQKFFDDSTTDTDDPDIPSGGGSDSGDSGSGENTGSGTDSGDSGSGGTDPEPDPEEPEPEEPKIKTVEINITYDTGGYDIATYDYYTGETWGDLASRLQDGVLVTDSEYVKYDGWDIIDENNNFEAVRDENTIISTHIYSVEITVK